MPCTWINTLHTPQYKPVVLSFLSVSKLKATENKIARARREDMGVRTRIRRQMSIRF